MNITLIFNLIMKSFPENLLLKFNKKKQMTNTLSPIEQSIFDCKISRDNIKKYIKKIESNSKESHQKAKVYLHDGKKDRAKFYLVQKKMYLEQVKNSEIQLEMINKQIANIEMSMLESEVFSIMKKSNTVLRKLQEEVSEEHWTMVNDELNQYKEEQKEVELFFSNRDMNHDDIDKELYELEEIEFPNAENSDLINPIKDNSNYKKEIQKIES